MTFVSNVSLHRAAGKQHIHSESGAKNPTLPMVSVGEIPYASQAFYTASSQTKYCYSNEHIGKCQATGTCLPFCSKTILGWKIWILLEKRVNNYTFGVFSCMDQGKDWYITRTFKAQCTQNNMEHPCCIKDVIQQREQLLNSNNICPLKQTCSLIEKENNKTPK